MVVVLILASCFIFAACSSGPASMGQTGAASGEAYTIVETGDEQQTNQEGGSSPELGNTARKRAYTADLMLETKEFDETYAKITTLIENTKDSFISFQELDNSMYSKNIYLTVKVPTALYEKFLTTLQNEYSVVSMTEQVVDITAEFIDAKSRLVALEAQEERLLELMKESGSLTDLLTIEKYLTEVQYQIVACKATVEMYEEMVSYSTFNINLREVGEYTEPAPETFGSRFASTARLAWNNTVVFSRPCLDYSVPVPIPCICSHCRRYNNYMCSQVPQKKEGCCR